MCAEALADIVVFNQTFLQAKKCKKKKNLNYAVCVRGSRLILLLFIMLFRVQKTQKKKNLNYAVCVSRLSADYCFFLSNFFACKKHKKRRTSTSRIACRGSRLITVSFYQTFSRAKKHKKRRTSTTRFACRGSRLSPGTKKDALLFFAVGLEPAHSLLLE